MLGRYERLKVFHTLVKGSTYSQQGVLCVLVNHSQGKSEVHMSKPCALVTLQLSPTICGINIIILA